MLLQAAGLGWKLLRFRTWSCGGCRSAGQRANGSASPPPPSMLGTADPARRRPWAKAVRKGLHPRPKGWATSRTARGTCRHRRTGRCTPTSSPMPSPTSDALSPHGCLSPRRANAAPGPIAAVRGARTRPSARPLPPFPFMVTPPPFPLPPLILTGQMRVFRRSFQAVCK
jgi:hypothetical protein